MDCDNKKKLDSLSKIAENSDFNKNLEASGDSLSDRSNKNINFQDERKFITDDSNIDANKDISNHVLCSSTIINIDASSDSSRDSSSSTISLHTKEFELKKFKKISFPNSLANQTLLNDTERASEIKLDESYSSNSYVNEITNVYNLKKCDTVLVNNANNRFISNDSKRANSNWNKSDLQENDLKHGKNENIISYRALINGSEHVFYAPIGGTVHLFYSPNEKNGHLYYADKDHARLYYLTCGNTVHYYNAVSQSLACVSEVIDKFMNRSEIHSVNENIVDKDLSLSNEFRANYDEHYSLDQEPLSSPNQNLKDFKFQNRSLRSQSHEESQSFMSISCKYLNENDLCENNAQQQNKSNFISSLQSIAQYYSDPQHSPSKEIQLPSISKNNKNLNLKPRRSTSAKLLEPKMVYTNLSPISSPISIGSKKVLNKILDESLFIKTSTNNIHTSSPKRYAENMSDNSSISKSCANHTLIQSSSRQENMINKDNKNKARVKQPASTFNEKYNNLTNDNLSHQTLNHDRKNIDQQAFEMTVQFDGVDPPINLNGLQPCMKAVASSLLQRLDLQQPNIHFPHQSLNQNADTRQYLNSQQQQPCVHVIINNLHVEPQQQH